MPWQTAPGVIIVAAFSVSGMAIPLIHKLIKGEARDRARRLRFLMAKRDKGAAEKKEGLLHRVRIPAGGHELLSNAASSVHGRRDRVAILRRKRAPSAGRRRRGQH